MCPVAPWRGSGASVGRHTIRDEPAAVPGERLVAVVRGLEDREGGFRVV